MISLKNRHQSEGYDFCDTGHCQLFFGKSGSVAQNLAVAASEKTMGDVLGFNREIVPAFVTRCCGGVTATPEMIWDDFHTNLLKQVECPHCVKCKYSTWNSKIKKVDIVNALKSVMNINLKPDITVKTEFKGIGSFVTRVSVSDGQRETTLNGDSFRTIVNKFLGQNTILSNRYYIEPGSSSFQFKGHGLGHGVGLCLEGALKLEKSSYDYRTILSYYFPELKIIPIKPER